jgi:quinolinate synthase
VSFSASEIQNESKRLHKHLGKFGYSPDDCIKIAPIVQEIHALKKEKNVLILAHSYQTPDITYGVADHIGDSYGLSVIAQKTSADIILFSSVLFMGETAKILNPEKTVLVPSRAGCSLSDSLSAHDVQEMRKKYPSAAFVAYINTTAAVKAEVDVCCTSSNAHKIVEALPQKQVVFLPDALMGKNLKKHTTKELVLWDGVCTVHEEFSKHDIDCVRSEFPTAKILAHPECEQEVIQHSDFVGSTEQMLRHLHTSSAKEFMMVTECGLSDRAKNEYPEKKIVGTCSLCPYMKELTLKNILRALKAPTKDQIITIETSLQNRAKKSLQMMFLLEKEYEKKIWKTKK